MTRRIWTKPFIKYNLSGDRTVAKSLERKARACVGYLFDQLMPNQKFKSQIWNYPDGSRITAFVWRDILGERARVEVFAPGGSGQEPLVVSFVIDAGLLRVINLGGGNFTNVVYLPEDIRNKFSTQTTLFSSAHQDDGMSGIFYPNGVVTVLSVRENTDTPDPCDSLTLPLVGSRTPSKPAYALYTKDSTITQLAASYVPASLFTGKLRLFVQSLYGSTRDDVTLFYEELLWPMLYVGETHINYRGTQSNFLVTADDWTHWLAGVSLSDGSVTVSFREVKIKPTSRYANEAACAKDVLTTEDNGFDPGSRANKDQSILESILFAGCEVVSEVDQTATDSFTFSGFPLGSPLEYGWHANWDGSKARIVLITSDYNTYGVAYAVLELSITHTFDQETKRPIFSVSAAVVKNGKAKVQNDFCVWHPIGVYQTSSEIFLSADFYMCGTSTEDPIIIDPPVSFNDFVVYGWYDKNNIWKEATWSRQYESNNVVAVADSETIICHGSSTNKTVGEFEPRFSTQYTVTVAEDSETAVTCPSFTAFIRYAAVRPTSSVSDNGTQLKYHALGSYASCNGGVNFGGVELNYDTVYGVDYTDAVGDANSVKIENYSSTAGSAMFLLMDDCDAAGYVSSEVVSVSGGAYWWEVGTFLGTDGHLYTAVWSLDGNGNRVENLWSGSDVRGRTTFYNLNWGSESYQSFSGNTREKVAVVIADINGAASIDKSVTSTNNPILEGMFSSLGSYAIPLPHPVETPWGNRVSDIEDWKALTDAPYGVCSIDLRTYTYSPSILCSAVFNSELAKGTPSSLSNINKDNNLIVGNSFIGWS